MLFSNLLLHVLILVTSTMNINKVFSSNVGSQNLTLAYKTSIGCHSWGGKGCWNPWFTGSYSSPAISNKNSQVIVGSYDNFLYNLDLATGTVNWKTEGPGGEDSPKLSSDELYVYAWGKIQGSTLDKVRVADGVIEWSWKSTSEKADITTAGAVDDDLNLVFAGTSGGIFSGISTVDGKTVWSVDMGNKGEMWGTLGPLDVDENTVCVGVGGNAVPYLDMGAKVVCLEKKTGDKIWETNTGKQIQSKPSMGESNIYVGDYDGSLYGMDKTTGELLFRTKLGFIIESSSLVVNYNDREVVIVDSWDGNVSAVYGDNGSLFWKSKIADPHWEGGGVGSSPVYFPDNESIFLGGPTGVFELAVKDGSTLQFYETGHQCGSSPAISENKERLVIACEDGYFYGFAL